MTFKAKFSTFVLQMTLIFGFLYPSFVGSQTNFTKNQNNPILDAGPSSWDSWGVYGASVLHENGLYKMWYTGADGSPWFQAIGYATSPDGLNWTKLGSPVLSPAGSGNWDADIVQSSCVLFLDGQYMMWYTGGARADRNKIGLATSVDGINWVRDPGNPVLNSGLSGEWDDKHVIDPSVFYDGNLYHMWYVGQKLGGDWRIGYATSIDGRNWQKHPDNPVLKNGPSNWESRHVAGASVVWNGNQFVMFYQGTSGSHWQIGVAYSNDGSNWTKDNSNPVIMIGPDGDWDDEHIGSHFALLESNQYEMWYSGSQDGSHSKIGYASSPADVIIVDIDIKPGSFPNSINLKSKGVIPVAILSTDNFDATTVDPLSVKFGPGEATESHNKGHIEDADGDGDLDLVLHFKTQNTGILCGDTEASLTGKTNAGQDIAGTDVIQTVGCKSAKTVAQGENEDIMPVGILLHQNYPNPFNPETKIRYSLPQTNNVSLKIYNINGDIIRTLVNAKVEAGEHFIRWDGTDNNGFLVASGVYYYELMVGTFRQVNKMTLIR